MKFLDVSKKEHETKHLAKQSQAKLLKKALFQVSFAAGVVGPAATEICLAGPRCWVGGGGGDDGFVAGLSVSRPRPGVAGMAVG